MRTLTTLHPCSPLTLRAHLAPLPLNAHTDRTSSTLTVDSALTTQFAALLHMWSVSTQHCNTRCGVKEGSMLNGRHTSSSSVPAHHIPHLAIAAVPKGSKAGIVEDANSPFAHQRLLWCIRGSNSPWSEFCMRTWWLPVDKKRQQATQALSKTDENLKHVVSTDPGCSQ